MLCGVRQAGGGDDVQATFGEYLGTQLRVVAFQTNHNRHFNADFFNRTDDALSDHVAANNATKNVDQHGLHVRVGHKDPESILDTLHVCPAADVEDPRRLGEERRRDGREALCDGRDPRRHAGSEARRLLGRAGGPGEVLGGDPRRTAQDLAEPPLEGAEGLGGSVAFDRVVGVDGLRRGREGLGRAVAGGEHRVAIVAEHEPQGLEAVEGLVEPAGHHAEVRRQDPERDPFGRCRVEPREQPAAPGDLEELVQLGVDFTRLEDGRRSLGKEGGHTKRRVLHVKDVTGKAIEEALLDGIAKQGVTVLEHFFVIDLITSSKLRRRGLDVPGKEDRLLGLYALNVKSGEVETFRSQALVLATGGVGRVYQYTTNPSIATGDGVAMAYRAGVPVMNMEFVQFHPTTLYTKTDERFLITEAVRGEGAVLRDESGNTFMGRYHEQADLAPRDVVARAIDQEMKRSGAPHVWLDASPVGAEHFPERFPNVHQTCLRHGIDPRSDFIPVVPAAHYLGGGVQTNIDSSTSLRGLYACGEVACTGLHGANRLASNSLLEAIVMADKGVGAALDYLKESQEDETELPEWAEGDLSDSDERVVLSHNLDELKRALWDYVGIVRTTKRLERAQARIHNLAREINEYYWDAKVDVSLLELRNLVQVADLIVDCALQRKESRGLHYTLDFPERLDVPENVMATPLTFPEK